VVDVRLEGLDNVVKGKDKKNGFQGVGATIFIPNDHA
jgi:hypothetical protein